ncbi:MAG: 2-isopropylmalate synthase [Clostridiales bacterium]|nr:2-isopropylmalate synthase [Clostridiales bacterium]MCF8022445.1 2-isopropylmalate synthase [Clostridiales bacterium]
MSQHVYIFDTTLRDGEQSPGVNFNVNEKLEIAKQLARLGVDIIEAGFPVTSRGDFDAVQCIAREVKGVTIAGLARTSQADIDRAWEAVQYAEQPRIHTFIATSNVHMQYKLNMTEEQVIDAVVNGVKHARKYTSDVEFSAEDAFRSDIDFLCRVLEAAVAAGATTVNVPDTVGYATPDEFGRFIHTIQEKVKGIDKIVTSIHCHDDLGLAVANSLSAVREGARQIEGTINGIGERAGNASLEEVVMSLRTRRNLYGLDTRVNTEEIYRTSKMISKLSGMNIQHNKAIVGKNAFAHESGIHQDGVLKERTTYEIMNPAMVGITHTNLVLGKLSGKHAFKDRLVELGYTLEDEDLRKAFSRFKDLADRKKQITDEDLEAIVEEEILTIPSTYELSYLHISSGSTVVPTATVGLKYNEEVSEEASCGNGPVDAICKAVDKMTGIRCRLASWEIDAVTSGKDALGDVTLKITVDEERFYQGRGISTDVLEASARAYVSAVNKMVYEKQKGRG